MISSELSVISITFSLLVALLCSFIIDIIYKKTYTGVGYQKTYSLAIILMSMVCAVAIKTVNSNITLSLGMLGSLSIIRFRTSVKDPIDIIFMFWAILVGIMSGASLYIPTIIATILIGLVYLFCNLFYFKKTNKYLVSIKADSVIKDEIFKLMNNKKGVILKSEIYKEQVVELTYEIDNKEYADKLIELENRLEVKNVNLINID